MSAAKRLAGPTAPVTVQPVAASVEHPIRCPHCMKVYFASDSLPIRPE